MWRHSDTENGDGVLLYIFVQIILLFCVCYLRCRLVKCKVWPIDWSFYHILRMYHSSKLENPISRSLIYIFFSVAASLDRPEHVHISLGKNDSMVVMWSTRHVTGGIVQYGVMPENMTFAVPSSIASLPEEYVKANPYIHRAELKVRPKKKNMCVFPVTRPTLFFF